jgi:hypothetical protein
LLDVAVDEIPGQRAALVGGVITKICADIGGRDVTSLNSKELRHVNAARAVSATVHSKPTNAPNNEKTCRAYAASFYKSVMLRQAAAGRVDGAWLLIALDFVINAFNDLLATNCGG